MPTHADPIRGWLMRGAFFRVSSPAHWPWGRSLCFEAIMSDLCRHVIGSRAGSDRPRGHYPRFRFSSKARRGMS